MSEETPGVVSHRLLDNFSLDENFPTLEQIDRAEPEFWRRIKEHGRVDSRGGRPTKACIAETNFELLLRYRDFRRAAEYVAHELAAIPSVARAALFGSLTKPLWKEVPRFHDFRRHGIAVWHEVKDVDMALWISDLEGIPDLKRARSHGVTRLQKEKGIHVAAHEFDIFLFDPKDSRYLGRVCHYKECPKRKLDCQVPGCGATKFLRQHAGFQFHHEALNETSVVVFFDRQRRQDKRQAGGVQAGQPREVVAH